MFMNHVVVCGETKGMITDFSIRDGHGIGMVSYQAWIIGKTN